MSERVNNEATTAYSQSSSSVVAHLARDLLDSRARVKELEEHNNAMLTSMRRFLARLDEIGQRDENREIITVECTFAFVESLRRALGEGE